MGICCSSHNTIEDTICKHFEKMKIWSLNIDQVEKLFKDLSPSELKEKKKTFSSKALAVFVYTLNIISKENWINFCESKFVDQSDTKENIDSQLILFKIIYDIQGEFFKIGNKNSLLINLIPYLVNSNISSKSSKFFELISIQNLRFSQFKSNFTFFVKNALTCEILVFKEHSAKSTFENEKEKENSVLNEGDIHEYLNSNLKMILS